MNGYNNKDNLREGLLNETYLLNFCKCSHLLSFYTTLEVELSNPEKEKDIQNARNKIKT
jgi:hypothetical protein